MRNPDSRHQLGRSIALCGTRAGECLAVSLIAKSRRLSTLKKAPVEGRRALRRLFVVIRVYCVTFVVTVTVLSFLFGSGFAELTVAVSLMLLTVDGAETFTTSLMT